MIILKHREEASFWSRPAKTQPKFSQDYLDLYHEAIKLLHVTAFLKKPAAYERTTSLLEGGAEITARATADPGISIRVTNKALGKNVELFALTLPPENFAEEVLRLGLRQIIKHCHEEIRIWREDRLTRARNLGVFLARSEDWGKAAELAAESSRVKDS